MSKDPLALSALTTGPLREAEYDAVYAAVTATDRGRWFLNEFASRNRTADTQTIVAAIARIEAAMRGEAAAPAANNLATEQSTSTTDLAAIAAIVERLQAVLGDTGKPAVALLLRELADRVARSIEAARGGRAPPPASGPLESAALIRSESPHPPAVEVPAPAEDRVTAAAAPLSIAAIFDDGPLKNGAAATPSAQPGDGTPPRAATPMNEAQGADASPRWHIEAPDFVFQPPEREANQNQIEAPATASQNALRLPDAEMPGERDEPVETFDAGVLEVSAAVFSAAVFAPATASADTPPAAAEAVREAAAVTASVPEPVVGGAASVHRVARPAQNDPLGAMRTLSEEELNALFG